MPKKIIIFSGPIAAGKSTIAKRLSAQHEFIHVKTQDLIQFHKKVESERAALQQAGEQLDKETDGEWVAKGLARVIADKPEDANIIVDSVRIQEQATGLRKAFGDDRVIHIHLTAPTSVLKKRYSQRHGKIKELPKYEDVQKSQTEQNIEHLRLHADIVISTERCNEDDVYVQVASRLGLYGRAAERVVDVMIGGQYGSEGKGHVASYLAREYDVLIRVGGPNAGHTVYLEPDPYTHHQLPSGTKFAENAKIVLAPGSVLYVPKLLDEINECQVDPKRICIDPRAMIIEDADRENESALMNKIGSTAQGVGYATSRKILRTSSDPPVKLARDVKELKPYIKETIEVLDSAFSAGKKIFLEGTQGTGLSLHHSYYPHVTSRDTSVSGCLSEAGVAPSRVRRIIMVCRTYPIRVESPEGETSGPMGQELNWTVISERSKIPREELEAAEKTSTTKRKRRVAEFDWAMLRKATSLNGPTDIALTFTDYLAIENRDARRFEQLSQETINFIEEIERVAAAPVSMIVTRFHSRSIIDRRNWW